MHSVRHSRSRILFEVLCALAIAASFVGAWMQTGAWALLPAAGAATLYGLFHLFDMAGRRDTVSVEPQRIDFATDGSDALACDDADFVLATADLPLKTGEEAELSEPVIPAAPSDAESRRTKTSRKAGSRRTKAAKETNVAEIAPLEDVETASIDQEPAEAEWPAAHEEVAHAHIEALFEPEPFARMPRRAFGRKGG